MKKINTITFRSLAAVLAVVMLAFLFLPISAAAATNRPVEEKFKNLNSKSSPALMAEFVKDAPKVDIAWYRMFWGLGMTNKKVDQYQVQPGSYYIVSTPGKSKMPYFSYKLVRVIRVYEDPTWYGSERKIDYINAETKKYGSLYLNKGLKPAHLYDVDKYIVR